MTDLEIISADLKKNHGGKSVSAAAGMAQIHSDIQAGAALMRFGDSLYLCTDLPDAAVEWHTINAARFADLVENTAQFLQTLREKKIASAVTYYDNPRVTEALSVLTKNHGFAVDVSKIDGGADRTYQAIVGL